jgi:uncharacterized protein (DUF305 family)
MTAMHSRISRGAAMAVVALLVAAPAAAQAKTTPADRAFVREMVPHHRMAVEMAEMARTQASHTRIKTLAKSIIEDQNAEIRELSAIRKRLHVKPLPTGHEEHETMMRDAETLGLTMEEMGMSMDMDELDGAEPFDRTFIDMMITHHQGAIRMARAELATGSNAQLRAIARAIVAAQKREITEMNRWRKQWYGGSSPSGGVPRA